jgi:hypothetical protein
MTRAALAALILSAVPAFADGPKCVEGYGTVACGYDCIADYGMVRCAQTPAGVCHADYGKVTCWDPPAARWGRRHVAKAQCLADYGTIACGYGCVADYGQVKCSPTPGGVCMASAGKIVCSE